jgi:hypothetical protein
MDLHLAPLSRRRARESDLPRTLGTVHAAFGAMSPALNVCALPRLSLPVSTTAEGLDVPSLRTSIA